MANPYRGEVAFPLFDGQPGYETLEPGTLVLRYRTGDLVQLRQKYGETYRQGVLAGLDHSDPLVVNECLKHGLKKPDGKPFALTPPMLEDLPFDLAAASELIMDALFRAWHGKSLAEIQREVAERQAQTLPTLDGEDDDARPTTSSSGSSTPPLGQDSTLTLSGD